MPNDAEDDRERACLSNQPEASKVLALALICRVMKAVIRGCHVDGQSRDVADVFHIKHSPPFASRLGTYR